MNTGYVKFWCYAARHKTACEDEIKDIVRKGLCPRCEEEEENRKLSEALTGASTSESSGG